MKKIIPDKPAYPYPILPKEYFRFDASLNTSYERTEIFDRYITCYQSDNHDLLENNFQKMSPRAGIHGPKPVHTKPGQDHEELKGSSDPSHFIFDINVGKRRIRHITNLKLNGEFPDRLKID